VPEKEIQVWENMAKVYIEVDSQFGLTFEQKKDAYSLILMRSMCGELDFKKNMPKNSLSDATVGHILKRYRGE